VSTSQQVTDASTQLGLLLAIIALFTAALSSTLQSENTRQGGAHPKAWRRIMTLSVSLAVVSVASLVSLLSLVRLVIDSHGTRSWEPAFWVFLLVYVLLIPLCIWQISIAIGAFRLRS
jgi:drug/metabolite transporter (DMT)-like permease